MVAVGATTTLPLFDADFTTGALWSSTYVHTSANEVTLGRRWCLV